MTSLSFLEIGFRSLTETEQIIRRRRAEPDFSADYERLSPYWVLDPDLEPLEYRAPCVKIVEENIPVYHRLIAPRTEFAPKDTIRQILYFFNDPSRRTPSGQTVAEEKRKTFRVILDSVDPRSNLLKIYCTGRSDCGRFYAHNDGATPTVGGKAGSLITIDKKLRSTLMAKHRYVDVDQVKSHPTLMLVAANLLGIRPLALRHYIDNVAAVLTEIALFYTSDPSNPVTVGDVKELIIRTTNFGGVENWIGELLERGIAVQNQDLPGPDVFVGLKRDLELIRGFIVAGNPHLCSDHTLSHLDRNKKIISRFMFTLENHVSNIALDFCINAGVIPSKAGEYQFIYGFDGFSWVPQSELDMDALMDAVNNCVLEQCGEAFADVKFIDKAIPQDLVIPEVLDNNHELWKSAEFHGFLTGEVVQREKRQKVIHSMSDKGFDQYKLWFEFDHFKVESRGNFGAEIKDPMTNNLHKVVWFDRASLVTTFEQYSYLGVNSKGEPQQKPFVLEWLKCSNMRVYQSAGTYPPPRVCPDDHFNIWTESEFHDLPLRVGETEDVEFLEAFQELQRCVCGCKVDAEVGSDEWLANDYMTYWIATGIQRPAFKPGIMPILTGSEGTGKTTFASFLRQLFGENRSIETTLDHLVGNFNHLLEGCVFVIVNEISSETLEGNRNALMKSLITDEIITINSKNVKPYQIQSFHRFLGTSNEPAPFRSDRRPLYLHSTLELKGRYDKFEALHKGIKNKKSMASAYRYFQNINIEERWGPGILKPPNDARNRELRIAVDPFVDFAHYLMRSVWKPLIDIGHQDAVVTPTHLHQLYSTWITEMKITEKKPQSIPGLMMGFTMSISWDEGAVTKVENEGVGKRRFNFAKMRSTLDKLAMR